MKRAGCVIGMAVALGWVWASGAAEVSRIRRDEEVVLYPALGWRTAGGAGWEVEIHGCLYEPERRRLAIGALRSALGLSGVDMTEEQQHRFTERTRLFLVDHEGGRKIVVQIGERRFPLGKTGNDGRFHAVIRLPDGELAVAPSDSPARMGVQLVMPREDPRRFAGEIHFLPETGLNVVTDIDDTVKITEVASRAAVLRNTFLDPFRPVVETRDDFSTWPASQRPAFHYVSASPWQIYPPLAEFLVREGFPNGTFHLKQFRVKDRSAFSLFEDPEEFKAGAIEPLLRRYPKRRFILVGDSGERDPEVYGTLARRFPAQIERICIRDVGGASADPERWKRAFAGLPLTLWQVEPAVNTRGAVRD